MILFFKKLPMILVIGVLTVWLGGRWYARKLKADCNLLEETLTEVIAKRPLATSWLWPAPDLSATSLDSGHWVPSWLWPSHLVYREEVLVEL